MASSWGDSRTSFRVGPLEIWLDRNEVDDLWGGTVEMLAELRERSERLAMLEPATPVPWPAAG